MEVPHDFSFCHFNVDDVQEPPWICRGHLEFLGWLWALLSSHGGKRFPHQLIPVPRHPGAFPVWTWL